MLLAVEKRGNTLVVRIPTALAAKVNLTEGCQVTIEHVDDTLVVRPVRRRGRVRPTLQSLLAKCKPQNRHGELDRSGPVGREII